jgi:hypothetical protein
MKILENPRALVGAIAFFAVVSGALGFLLAQRNMAVQSLSEQNASLDLERNQLTFDLEKMRFSYDTLQAENSLMLAEITAQRAQVDDLIKKVKTRNWSLSKAKKEASALRSIMKGYVATIDSLNQLNIALSGENEAMRAHVDEVQDRNSALQQRQDNMESIISTGQILQVTTLNAQPIRLLTSGRQRETSRALRTDMIRVCFQLMENRIAEPGRKQLHIQIVDTAGNILPPAEGAAGTTPEGTPVSASRLVDYANNALDACVFFTPQSPLAPGIYRVTVLEGEEPVGTTDLELR